MSVGDDLEVPFTTAERIVLVVILLLLATICVVFATDYHNRAVAKAEDDASQRALDQINEIKQRAN